ncbi:MAG TPA: amylo-alpha-1,6-glucosidase [Tepidisphaeraceae bacterium]|nr:amylo-alpha-1,6-glucosidase [Tepidisphaeraceae bacterium]
MPQYEIETNGQLQPHLQQEWLLSNGLGGFASSTIVGCNTRRYHGLLCAATLPPVGRIMALSRLGAILTVDGNRERTLEFSVNQFKDTFHPRGDQYLRRFALEDTAVFYYDVEGIRVTKEVLVPWLKNVVAVRYAVDAQRGREVELCLLPFVNLRDFHGTRRANSARFNVRTGERTVMVDTGGQHVLHVQSDGGSFKHDEGWWYDHTFALETQRGLDDQEDLFSPGRFVLGVTGSGTITIWAALESTPLHDWEAERRRRSEAVAAACAMPANVAPPPARAVLSAGAGCAPVSLPIRKLARAANDFVVARKTPDGKPGTSILAGYPWFADWGRDTFISLPGLLLATRRFEQARQVLSLFASYVSEGMIPNRFDDYSNEPHYNTVDASLWFIHSAFEYFRLTSDYATFERVLQPACRAIIDGYRRGTRFGIRMDERDGLITQGDATTQLTWMDAKCGDHAYTPRQGKAVEINALWYHALVLMGERDLAKRCAESFRTGFWISPFRGLADVIDGETPADQKDIRRDTKIRPNQIFAVSLPNSALLPEQMSAVVEVVRRELLTPYGLRTLAPSDPGYQRLYKGPQVERDAAYHNGIAWPWLIGGFLDAYLKVHNHSKESIEQAKQWLAPLLTYMDTAIGGCVGQLPELYEPEEPYRAVGTCAQAWSVAEVLRLAVLLGV